MIVCSCALVSDEDLRRAVASVMQNGANPTFRAVYQHLDKRARCGNCRPLVLKLIKQAKGRSPA